jgi:hypothetical protein
MSDEPSPLFFSAEDLMPSWAQAKSDKPAETTRETRAPREREDDRRGGGDRGGRGGSRDDRGGPRGDRRGGGGGSGFRSDRGPGGGDRRDGQRSGGGPRGDGDRRGGGGGDRRTGGGERRGGGDRREGGDRPFRGRDDRPPQDRPRQDVLPTGIKATLEPTGAAVQGLAKHIRESGRVFPVSDLAKVVLQSRDRYQLVLQAEEGISLFRCQVDGSLWLTREEAFSHLLQGPALEEYYVTEDVSVDPPSGNFSTIAVCGMSGVILGPPNHHEYQRNIMRLHGERFSNMSLERYKSRIEMQSGEEVVEKWKEQVSRVRQYRVRTAEDAIAAVDTVSDEPAIVEETNEIVSEEGSVAVDAVAAAEESPTEETSADSADEVAAVVEEIPEASGDQEVGDAEASDAPAPAPVRDGLVFKNLAEVSKHFRENFAAAAVWEQSKAVIPGNIAFKLLSPGLQTLVRSEGENARRGFPIAMMQTLCRELEKVGLKFFKVGKKALHVGLVRPKSLDQTAVLTDSIKLILDHVAAHPKCTVVSLLEALVPDFKRPETGAEATELPEAARLVLRDQRWLTAEGYLLEFPDTSLRLGRLAPAPDTGESIQPIAVKQPKKKAARPAKADVAPVPAVAPAAESAEAEAVVEDEDEVGIDLPEFACEAEEDALPESVDPVEVL